MLEVEIYDLSIFKHGMINVTDLDENWETVQLF